MDIVQIVVFRPLPDAAGAVGQLARPAFGLLGLPGTAEIAQQRRSRALEPGLLQRIAGAHRQDRPGLIERRLGAREVAGDPPGGAEVDQRLPLEVADRTRAVGRRGEPLRGRQGELRRLERRVRLPPQQVVEPLAQAVVETQVWYRRSLRIRIRRCAAGWPSRKCQSRPASRLSCISRSWVCRVPSTARRSGASYASSGAAAGESWAGEPVSLVFSLAARAARASSRRTICWRSSRAVSGCESLSTSAQESVSSVSVPICIISSLPNQKSAQSVVPNLLDKWRKAGTVPVA